MTDVLGRKGEQLPPQCVVVERGPIGNFATAVTDPNPVFHDARAAAAAGFDAVPAPPTFNFVMHTFGAFAELQPAGDGESNPVTSIIGQLMADGGMILHGEQSFRYQRPIVVGDVLTSTGRISDIEVKVTDRATMTFVVTETEWHDAEGLPVCQSTMTLIHRR